MRNEERKPKPKPDDFIPEVIGKPIAMELIGQNEPVVGVILDSSKYWVKFQDVNGKLIYFHKAYLKSITPLKQ